MINVRRLLLGLTMRQPFASQMLSLALRTGIIMPKSMPWTFALLCALLLSPTVNAAEGDVDALELSQNWRGLIGKTVTITGCQITSATPDLMVCLATSEQGRPPSFWFDPSGMAPDDIARAVRECDFYVGYPVCGVRLTGEVAEENGEVKIMGGSVTWNSPPLTP